MSFFHFNKGNISPRKTAQLTRKASALREKASESIASLSCIMQDKIRALQQALRGGSRLERTLHSKKSPSRELLLDLLPQLTQDYQQLSACRQSGEHKQYARLRKSISKQLSGITFRDSVERDCILRLESYANRIEQERGAHATIEPDLTLYQLRRKLDTYHSYKKRERAVYEQLVKGHLALVRSIASQQYHTSALGLEDLIQEGSLGLLAALKEFDSDRGISLSTFATPIIQQHITRSIYNKERPIRFPV